MVTVEFLMQVRRANVVGKKWDGLSGRKERAVVCYWPRARATQALHSVAHSASRFVSTFLDGLSMRAVRLHEASAISHCTTSALICSGVLVGEVVVTWLDELAPTFEPLPVLAGPQAMASNPENMKAIARGFMCVLSVVGKLIVC